MIGNFCWKSDFRFAIPFLRGICYYEREIEYKAKRGWFVKWRGYGRNGKESE